MNANFDRKFAKFLYTFLRFLSPLQAQLELVALLAREGQP